MLVAARGHSCSFDDLVGAQENRRRNHQAELPRGSGVYGEVEVGGPFDWEISRRSSAKIRATSSAVRCLNSTKFAPYASRQPAAAISRHSHMVGSLASRARRDISD